MKTLNFTVLVTVVTLLMSCGGSISKQTANKEGFGAIEKEMKSKFGEDAYYTDLTISYNSSIGNIINVTVTEKPESLKMGEWIFSNGSWVETSEVSLELPEGTKATDFMFQLNEDINLSKLGELVVKSCNELITEKKLENPALHMAFVKFPDNGNIASAEYLVMLKPETGGTTFTFNYKLNGELINMDY